MLRADTAIVRVQRDLTLSTLLKAVLACALAGSLLLLEPDALRLGLLVAVGTVWFWLSLNSAKSSRRAAEFPFLIAAGMFEEAERNVEQTVRTFSLARTVKLQALHHFALLRHAQQRWQEAAMLSRALLGQRLGPLQSLSRTSRLLLADALLELDDYRGAYDAMIGLYHEPLSLNETLNLLAIQTDYSARIGAWESMMQNVMAKIQLAELMPAPVAARTQAMLALAAKRVGRDDLFQWLRGRAELLDEVRRLKRSRPMLRELWDSAGQ